jgi:hypothetical protein
MCRFVWKDERYHAWVDITLCAIWYLSCWPQWDRAGNSSFVLITTWNASHYTASIVQVVIEVREAKDVGRHLKCFDICNLICTILYSVFQRVQDDRFLTPSSSQKSTNAGLNSLLKSRIDYLIHAKPVWSRKFTITRLSAGCIFTRVCQSEAFECRAIQKNTESQHGS